MDKKTPARVSVQNEKLELNCPTCRQTTKFEAGFDPSFRKNFAVIGMLQDEPPASSAVSGQPSPESVFASLEESIARIRQVREISPTLPPPTLPHRSQIEQDREVALQLARGRETSEATEQLFDTFSGYYRANPERMQETTDGILPESDGDRTETPPRSIPGQSSVAGNVVTARDLGDVRAGATKTGKPPRVFVSYSRDSQEHADTVLSLATTLRQHGVASELDVWSQKDRSTFGLSRWIEVQLREADFVLVICSPLYKRMCDTTSRYQCRPLCDCVAGNFGSLFSTHPIFPSAFSAVSFAVAPTAPKTPAVPDTNRVL